MTDFAGLHLRLKDSVERFPDRVAVEEAEGESVTYRELAALSDQFCNWLTAHGIGAGDRVGLYLPKSIDGVAAILGSLQCGAAYVPVDPLAPASRGAYILSDCAVRVVVVERAFAAALEAELKQLGASPELLVLDAPGGGAALRAALEEVGASREATTCVPVKPTDLAYLLYTSGSTGRPKGVMLTHGNALCFVDWCGDVFSPTELDRFSSHAPFHFDLSILDLFVPLCHGASVVLFGESLGKEPVRLAERIHARGITVWYSAPSILTMLVGQGQLDQYDWSALRMVLFAGEVFPVKHLRALKSLWPAPRYFNLYGPTETNVCTWYEVPYTIPAERTEPYPIGKVCGHYHGRIVDPEGREVSPDSEGELCISGPGVMQGYWNLDEQNRRVFLDVPDGACWYRTGDVVQPDADGNLRFLGRRDRMIKKRGYRVELGEIEAALYRQPDVKEAAVIAESTEEDVRVRAFLSTKSGQRISIIALKQFCIQQLPPYMIPDTFTFLDALPKTSTDKIDYQRLKELV
jgi:amino acid adenylation domain-containing protein